MKNITVVFCHGMWGNSSHWDNYVSYFSKHGYSCKAVNLPYHGEEYISTPHPNLSGQGLDDYVDFIVKESKGHENVVLFGHSMGGLIVFKASAIMKPKATVMIAPAAPKNVWSLYPSTIRSYSEVMMRWGFWKKPNKLTPKKAIYSMYHLMSKAEQQRLTSEMCWESGKAGTQIGFNLKASEALPINNPGLIISGLEDRITPPATHRQMSKKYELDLKLFSNHAHFMLGEPGWDIICNEIQAWLEKNL